MPSPPYPPLEHLRPREIARLARDPGLLLQPVSPAIEWHSHHLPVGTDAVIVEEVATRLAARFGAAYCRVLSLGLDERRTAAFKTSQGLDPQASVFGMNYPGLPVASEYTDKRAMRTILRARIAAARATGFRVVALVNHHGGRGQIPLLQQLARESSTRSFRVILLQTTAGRGPRLPWKAAFMLRTGGHAGLAETIQLMAFRPDLIRVGELPEGPLHAGHCGILHDEPRIPAEANPRRAPMALAHEWRRHVLDSLSRQLERVLRKP